ncbi:MAG TPA: hypothetical protein VIL25_11855 [Vicinamibacterales bacterium]|nr:MAG: hypothetical protein DIU54_15790 [Acidobacteriota bacterium]
MADRNDGGFLRQMLLLDGAVSGATGALMAAAASPLETWLGLPAVLLRTAGFVLLPFAALVLALGRGGQPARRAVGAVVAMNVTWVIGSVLLLVTGLVQPSMFGYVFILVQAAAVAVLGELQLIGLRRMAQPA